MEEIGTPTIQNKCLYRGRRPNHGPCTVHAPWFIYVLTTRTQVCEWEERERVPRYIRERAGGPGLSKTPGGLGPRKVAAAAR